jgi:uncharacterized protein (DUF433 family)
MLALTTPEAAALTGLDERAVRKNVEHGILDAGSPPRFAEVALVYLRACASFAFHLDARDRKRLYTDIADALARGRTRLELGSGWTLDVAAVASDLHSHVTDFEAWRGALVTRGDILGGEPVFPGSRLAVRHIGEMLARGASPDEVREDHPQLTERDVEFARLFAVAYPRIGRPRGQAAAG